MPDHAKISRYNPEAVAKMLKSIQAGLSRHIGNWKLFAPKEETDLVDNIRKEFFLNVLSFPHCSTTDYTKEIKVATEGKKFPPY